MQFTFRRAAPVAASTALALTLLGAAGAPQDSTDAGAQQANRGVGSAETGTEIDSRTVQILLDIQSTKTPAENPVRPVRPIDGVSRAPVPIQAIGGVGSERLPLTELKPKKDSIQSETPDPSQQWARPASNSPRTATEEPRRVVSSDPSPGAGPADADASGWLPTTIMRFVRQNREVVVLVSLLALGLAAFFTASASKRR